MSRHHLIAARGRLRVLPVAAALAAGMLNPGVPTGTAPQATEAAAPAATAPAQVASTSTPAVSISAPAAADEPVPRGTLGFLPATRDAEARAERLLLDTPSPDRARAWVRVLTEEPHVAGTEEGQRLAEYVRDRFREFGLEAELNRYDVLLNHPKSVSLKLLKPEPRELSLREEGMLRDKDSYSDSAYSAFHGYGASGKAAGQVVYVNYGTREDFESLEATGLSVRGRIALVRYGKVFRGLKVKEAQNRGAIGVIIYSDPADDGYMKGDIYPDGPARPPASIQRGSVHYLSDGPGDPTTPGYASRPGAKRVPRDKVEGIPRIPSLPLSYGEARHILAALAGERVPDAWQGGLPFAYHLGPGPAEAAIEVEMDYGIRPIYNVIATIPGTTDADRLVVLGNHRDAWTYGAVDPNSGTASMLETARGLGAALRGGWAPRRTLVLASWDGEEYGLLGSTEWVEDRLESAGLDQQAVAYLNLDVSVTGPDLEVDGIPSLRDLVMAAAADVPEPRQGGSVLAAWRARKHREWAQLEVAAPEARFDLQMNPLGSGSDYTAFAHHGGIASLSFSFDGVYGVYHSIYDNFFWAENFGDPGFPYHVAAARLFGLMAMRLASADIVPLRYAPYGRAMGQELEQLRRGAIRDRRIWEASAGESAAARTASPAAAVEAGKRPAIVPDLRPIVAAIEGFAGATRSLDATLDGLETRDIPEGAGRRRLNDALVRIERAFLDPAGLPGRTWFHHLLYAPGLTTGYASWPFPGVVQTLKERDPEAVAAQVERVAGRIRAATVQVEAASSIAAGLDR